MNARSPRFSFLGGTLSLCAFSAVALLTLQPQARAQTPLLQYNFNGATGTGTNTGSTTGTGNLTANSTNGGASFAGTGVSGAAGDNALSLNNAYTGGTTGSVGSASNSGGANVGMLSQFTVTMWVKTTSADLASGVFPRLFQLGTVTNPDNTNPGVSMLLNGGGTLQLGVNGTTSNTAALAGLNNNVGQWVFLAFAYDGTSTTAYNSNAMNTNYGSFNDAALLLGTTTSATAVVANPGISTSASNFSLSPGAVATTATSTLYLGNNQPSLRGFTGSLDDVRVYSSLLTVSQLDAVRMSDIGMVPEPSTVVVPLACIGVLAFSLYRRKAAKA